MDAVSDRIHRILDVLQDSKLVPSYQDFQTYLESRDSKMLFMPGTAKYDEGERRRCAFLTALRSLEAEGVRSTMAPASLGIVVDIPAWVLPISLLATKSGSSRIVMCQWFFESLAANHIIL